MAKANSQSEWFATLNKYRSQHRLPIRLRQSIKKFVTGSEYEGEWVSSQMWGSGIYSMPHKAVYDGRLVDGEFHGAGVLKYPSEHQVDGFWERSQLIKAVIRYPDGLEYSYPFKYCKSHDRRFYSSMGKGLRPARRERLTNEGVARKIPEGCYDCGYGFYDPKIGCVFSAEDPNETIKIPTESEGTWIKNNCRKAWDEPVGYRPDLYEKWTNGCDDESQVASTTSSEITLDSMLDFLF